VLKRSAMSMVFFLCFTALCTEPNEGQGVLDDFDLSSAFSRVANSTGFRGDARARTQIMGLQNTDVDRC
jgi:hypothetical protein